MSFRIAIPSYKRAETLARKTLRLLESQEVKPDQIDIFVANESERTEYRRVLGPTYTLIVGVPGLHRQREFIHDYYPAGQRVLCLDDDVRSIKTLYPWVPFDVLIDGMFQIADREGCKLWGVYPTDCGLQLQDRAVKGLRYIVGAFYGMTNWKGLRYPDSFTEDATRTLSRYVEDGAVLRFEGVGIQTNYFTEPGGLQEFRTAASQEEQMRRLAARWPDYVVLRHKPGKMVDVRYKTRTAVVFDNPFGC